MINIRKKTFIFGLRILASCLLLSGCKVTPGKNAVPVQPGVQTNECGPGVDCHANSHSITDPNVCKHSIGKNEVAGMWRHVREYPINQKDKKNISTVYTISAQTNSINVINTCNVLVNGSSVGQVQIGAISNIQFGQGFINVLSGSPPYPEQDLVLQNGKTYKCIANLDAGIYKTSFTGSCLVLSKTVGTVTSAITLVPSTISSDFESEDFQSEEMPQ